MSLVVVFPKNLKRSRQKLKLSQAELAKRAEISVSYVSMLERGQRCPPLETLDRLALALDVPAVSLLKAA